MLVADGRLTQHRLDEAVRNQQQRRGRLGTSLLELGLVAEDVLLATLGRQRATKTVSNSELANVPAAVIRMIPPKLALRYAMVPFELKGKTLFVASGNVGDALKEDEIGFLTSCMVRTCIGVELRIFEALNRHYGVKIPERYQTLAKGVVIPRSPSSAAPRARQAGSMTPIPESLRGLSSPGPESAQSAAGSSSALRRLNQQATTTTLPPRTSPPPPTLFIELDEEDAALLGRSSDYEPTPASTVDEPMLLRPTPLPWLTREVKDVEAAKMGQVDAAVSNEPVPFKPAPFEPVSNQLVSNQPVSADSAPAEAATAPMARVTVTTAPVPTTPAPASPVSATPVTATVLPVELGSPALSRLRAESNLEERLQAAADELKHAEIRDDIADVLLAFSEPYFKRRLLLVARGDSIVGWRGEGPEIERDAVRSINIELNKPSVFLGLRSADSFWLGALPALPANQQLAEGLGGTFPKDCLVLPVTLRSRVVCYFYGDNLDAGVGGSPLAEFRRLTAMAALAFEVYILKHKMRLI